jgi:hypothetical protein
LYDQHERLLYRKLLGWIVAHVSQKSISDLPGATRAVGSAEVLMISIFFEFVFDDLAYTSSSPGGSKLAMWAESWGLKFGAPEQTASLPKALWSKRDRLTPPSAITIFATSPESKSGRLRRAIVTRRRICIATETVPGQDQPFDVVVFAQRQIPDLGSRSKIPHGIPNH